MRAKARMKTIGPTDSKSSTACAAASGSVIMGLASMASRMDSTSRPPVIRENTELTPPPTTPKTAPVSSPITPPLPVSKSVPAFLQVLE